jgi:Sec63 Brl domain
MLLKSPELVEAMVELAVSRRWLSTTLAILDFSQHLVQGLWARDSNLMQLPHISEAQVTLRRLSVYLLYTEVLLTVHTQSVVYCVSLLGDASDCSRVQLQRFLHQRHIHVYISTYLYWGGACMRSCCRDDAALVECRFRCVDTKRHFLGAERRSVPHLHTTPCSLI